MDLELTTQFESVLSKLAYSDDESESGWSFSLVDDYIIKFQPYGSLKADAYKLMAEGFFDLQLEYFKHADFLIFLFDFSNFKKASTEARLQIMKGNIFKEERVNIVIYGMNYFVSTLAKVISNRQGRLSHSSHTDKTTYLNHIRQHSVFGTSQT